MSGRTKRKIPLSEQVQMTILEVEGAKESLANLMDGLKTVVNFQHSENTDIPEDLFEEIKQVAKVVSVDYEVYQEAAQQCDHNYTILQSVAKSIKNQAGFENFVSNSCAISQKYRSISLPAMNTLIDSSDRIAEILSKTDESFKELKMGSIESFLQEEKEDTVLDVNVEVTQ